MAGEGPFGALIRGYAARSLKQRHRRPEGSFQIGKFTRLVFSLRTYHPDDFETLYEIDQACYEPAIAYSRRELRNYLRFPGADCVVAEAKAEARAKSNTKTKSPKISIAGFCVTAHEDDWGYIITIDVLEPYRRLGVGTLLLAEAERRLGANGAQEIGLDTAVDNAAAIAFWQKHGYRIRGTRKGYYPGGRDAYAMAKKIARKLPQHD
jgi:[ribosomal protein S18]-alanine N-acetyltransferase